MIWYLSQQNGNDSNTGQSVSQALKTFAALQTKMTGVGDSAYIGPGTYRERFTFQAMNQTITADPLGLHLTSDTPGMVRITGCGVDEKPTSGAIIYNSGKVGCTVNGYSVDFPMYVDGCSSMAGCVEGSAGIPVVCNYVCAGPGEGGFNVCDCTSCLGMGAYYAFQNCNATNSLGLSSTDVFLCSATVTMTNCAARGGSGGGFASTVANTGVAVCINCIAEFCYEGFQGNGSTMVIMDCSSQACYYAAYGNTSGNLLNISSLTYSNCYLVQRGSGTYETGTPSPGAECTYDMGAIIRAFEPRISAGVFGLGTHISAPATDILGRALKNPPDIGPYSEVVTPRVGTNVPQISRSKVVNS